jgi:replication factor C small subunit
MSVVTELFTEKFRPKKLEQLIIPTRIRKQLEKGLVQNILLYGSSGTGKTSTLFILAQGHPYLYINASNERGIELLREKIPAFCSSISLMDGQENLKCVILDELDGATGEFFGAFKSAMERYSSTTRFIASCNFLQKIPPPIYESRFLPIAYDPINENEKSYLIAEYKKRVGAILKAANIAFTDYELEKFVMNDFPDLRAIINKIQSLYLREVKELTPENMATSSDCSDLFRLCMEPPTKPYENYKFIVNQYGSRVDEALTALGNDFPEYLKNMAPAKLDKLPGVLVEIAEYQYQKAFVIDPLITLLAAVFKVQQILN